MPNTLPLLIYTQTGEHIAFSPPRQGGAKALEFSYGNRAQHANQLLKQFDEILIETEQNRIKRISVKTRDGKNFPVESLNKSQMELLDWREEGDEHIATVLLPGEASSELKKKITDFRDTDITKKPKNENLVGRISSIGRVSADWYWKDGVVPLPESEEIWIEVWLARKNGEKRSEKFSGLCQSHGIVHSVVPLLFPECLIYTIYANREKLDVLVNNYADIRHCRACRELSSLILNDAPANHVLWTRHIKERLQAPTEGDPCVCILDSGCNLHPILEPLVGRNSLLCVKDGLSSSDTGEDGHGTAMAGVAAYGNINHVMMNANGPIKPHPIESCRICNLGDTDKLHGELTQRAVSLIEIERPAATRVFCMALTSEYQTKVNGNPSSWSAALDASTSMAGEEGIQGRLFVVSAGNRINYGRNKESDIDSMVRNPAQSWNVLTVGAATHLPIHIEPANYPKAELYAQDGGLSPYSTNSTKWKDSAPLKPDFLCEGGNILLVDDLEDNTVDMRLLAPNWKFIDIEYRSFWGTSLSSALATHMAASIMRAYPSLRPETIRALLVHSAEWTDEMKRTYLPQPNSSGYLKLARMCGHGEASLQRALLCMSNSLTLVHEGELTPYGIKNGKDVTYNEMVYHDLPWPKSALEALGEATVELKVTLSYFVEPNPSAIEGLESSYSYPSYSLKFSVRKSTDTREDHLKKVNKAIRDEDNSSVKNKKQYDGWQLGKNAFVGSVHSDIWEGSASDLASMGGIAIIPSSGWWKTRKSHMRYNDKARYSLVISIRTKDVQNDVNLYAEVENQIQNRMRVEANVIV